MGGAAVVLVAALGFYALRPLLGSSAMFVLWMALWLAFGLRNFDPRTIDYAYHFGCWTLAFLPAFLALLLERRS